MVWKREQPVQPTGVREGTGTAVPATLPAAPTVLISVALGAGKTLSDFALLRRLSID